MYPRSDKQPVTLRALGISIASLLVPVAVAFWFPDWTSTGYGMLVWLTALIPAFLLAYYRGLPGVALALAGGMAVITATQISIVAFDIADPDWDLLLGIVGVYLGVSVCVAGLSEVLRRERAAAEKMALTDRLTGLPNRRHADTVLAREFAAAQRGHDLTVVVFDLDRFKQVNDAHGHAAGDATIQAFAKILMANTRRENLTARYGGEEFISILRDSTPDGARVFAQRVLDQLRSWPLAWGQQTASAGIAAYESGMETSEALLAAADRALYRAKQAGRDKLEVAPQLRPRAVSASERSPHAPPRSPAPGVPPARREGMLYLVSSDGDTRTTLARALVARGYTVWETGDARAAIRNFAAVGPDEQPDLVVTDVAMPEMTGTQMIDVIAAISPGIRVIYLVESLYDRSSLTDGPGQVVAMLRKPVDAERLIEAIDSAAER